MALERFQKKRFYLEKILQYQKIHWSEAVTPLKDGRSIQREILRYISREIPLL